MPRNGGTGLQTQIFMATWNPEINGTHLLVAIIALASVLFVELIGIGVVIGKLIGARRRRRGALEAEKEPEIKGSYEHALIPIALGTIPQYTYSLITILSIAVAVGALILLVLMIAARANGYDFLSRAKGRRADKHDEETVEEEPAYVAPVRVEVKDDEAEEEYEETVEEEAVVSYEEAYTAEETSDEDADADESVVYEEKVEEVTEDAVEETVDEPVEETAQEVVEETVDEPVEEAAQEVAEETVEEVVEETVEEPAVVSGEVIPAAPAAEVAPKPNPAGATIGQVGQGPYKIVEKHVTETYKEIIKEVPAPTPAPAENTAAGTNTAEELLAKISDLIDHKIEQERANDATAKNNDSVPTFAKAEADADEYDEDADTDEDEDDDDAEDASDADNADADDVDDEENEIAEDRFTGNERILGIDEETGCYIVAHYRKSFEAKLIQARPNIKKYYSELKNALLSFKGTKSRVSWTADSFHNGRTALAKINVKTRILELYLAIDPVTLEGTVYCGKDVGSKKKYADTPFQYKLRTPRKFKWAMELVQRMCEEHGLTPIDIEHVAYDELYPFDTTDNLVERKLIKEYIRQEKPATTFELAEDHVPTVPDEDASVIPANANFTWEFDNDRMNEIEPEDENVEAEVVEEEPVAEEITVEETVAEEPPVQETPAPATVYKETVKVTEMRYTERYYANGEGPVTTVYTNDQMLDTPALAQLPDAETVSEELHEEIENIEDLPENAEKTYEEADEEAYEETEEETYEEDTEAAEETEEVEEDADEDVDEDVDEERFFADAPEVTYEEGYEEAYEEETEENYEEETEENYKEEAEENYEEDTEEAYEEEAEETYEEETEEASYEEAYEEPYEEKKIVTDPTKAVVDICRLEEHFPNGATINLDVLKEMGLVVNSAKKLSVYASRQEMTKSFTVEANKFTVEAVGVINTAGGDSVMLTE